MSESPKSAAQQILWHAALIAVRTLAILAVVLYVEYRFPGF